MENIQTKRFSQLRQSLLLSDHWMGSLTADFPRDNWPHLLAGRALEKLYYSTSRLLSPIIMDITPGSLPWRLVRKKLAAVLICSSDAELQRTTMAWRKR